MIYRRIIIVSYRKFVRYSLLYFFFKCHSSVFSIFLTAERKLLIRFLIKSIRAMLAATFTAIAAF
jgi:hypothetical protein